MAPPWPRGWRPSLGLPLLSEQVVQSALAGVLPPGAPDDPHAADAVRRLLFAQARHLPGGAVVVARSPRAGSDADRRGLVGAGADPARVVLVRSEPDDGEEPPGFGTVVRVPGVEPLPARQITRAALTVRAAALGVTRAR
ncbi:hypothetical protein GCM10025868_40650 [Angustibacter aerolatus]|uniref:Uncharacterized protein n=1 Tax=Angustibacter aerolatus TaxID=1162965 RepID=A0ABQ6JKN8_9ACTN|nr:hypothetical protein GCM10025868_40650 [Angustibacter aerolatus]